MTSIGKNMQNAKPVSVLFRYFLYTKFKKVSYTDNPPITDAELSQASTSTLIKFIIDYAKH